MLYTLRHHPSSNAVDYTTKAAAMRVVRQIAREQGEDAALALALIATSANGRTMLVADGAELLALARRKP